MKPNNSRFFSLVFYSVLNRIKQLTKSSRGSIVKFITKGDIEDIYIPLPKDHDNYFYETINDNFEQIDHLYKENLSLIQLRSWLSPMLLNGQVTIS